MYQKSDDGLGYVQGCEKNVVRDGGQYGLLMPLRIVEGYRCVFEGKKNA